MGSIGGRSDTRSERGVGDCHVYPKKEEKDRVLEKDREKDEEKEKEREREKEEVEKVDREQAIESAPLPAIEIEIPCDEMIRECIFVPIPIPLPIPIHPHAGDPLLVEDPGTVAELSMLLQFFFFSFLYIFLFILIIIPLLILLRLHVYVNISLLFPHFPIITDSPPTSLNHPSLIRSERHEQCY